jgi:adenylyltransferase/sulfurtransferase
LKELTGAGDTLAGHLMIYDAKDTRFEKIAIAWDPENALSGTSPAITDLSGHAAQPDETTCASPQ